jgi:putative CocE/NonD family hydrolase
MPGTPSGDGYATIEWVAQQAWCNGRIGMICGSYSGFTQYQTAIEAPPHLDALLVREGLYDAYWYPGGAAIPALIGLAAAMTKQDLQHYPPAKRTRARRFLSHLNKLTEEAEDPDSRVVAPDAAQLRLPFAPNARAVGVADYYNEWLSHPVRSTWWNPALLSRQAHEVRVPICHLGGWFDALLPHALAAYTSMRQRARDPKVRAAQRLIVGPWVHGPMQTTGDPIGPFKFGPEGRLDFNAFRLRWYDHHLKGRATGLSRDPRVWLYVNGADRWIGCADWPPPESTPTPWYMRTTGALSRAAPQGAEAPDAYEYDPMNPVPSLRGSVAMGLAVDQRPIEERLTTYTTPRLKDALALVGPVQLRLHAASSAPDTDWVAKLTWVRPNGASVVISGGILRARYRRSLSRPQLLETDKPELFEIEMTATATVIPAGHRLRLTLTSSDFPTFDRNLNTGGPIGHERHWQTAINLLFHDRLRPSHILLPVFGE